MSVKTRPTSVSLLTPLDLQQNVRRKTKDEDDEMSQVRDEDE